MRTLAVALVLLVAARATAAPLDLAALEKQLHAAKVKRNVGWGLAAGGTALLASGVVLVGVGAQASFEEGVVDVLTGIALLVVGLAVGVPGAVLALRGQGEITDLTWRIDVARQLPAPRAQGFTIRFRF